MADGHRKYPVDYIVLHHSVGDEFVNATALKIQDWFSRIGKSRGYKNGAIDPKHWHPSRPKVKSYAMAQYALHKSKNAKYGWSLVELIKDPMHNVAWHAGNWGINQRSIGIETCGNYVGKKLPDKALMLVADTFRAHDKKIGGKLQVTAHRQFMATACPGGIFDQRETVIDMINNPTKWNKKLWPKTDSDCKAKIEALGKIIKTGENALKTQVDATKRQSELLGETKAQLAECKLDNKELAFKLEASNKALKDSMTRFKLLSDSNEITKQKFSELQDAHLIVKKELKECKDQESWMSRLVTLLEKLKISLKKNLRKGDK